ncbi:CocE/NonD family hydrolase [Gemmatimonas phototrophica]|uniref:CocE/NonD family hydrolase n=1 Tax=Gemmatimonas phototrophica TaxID=1379270 RepID=UPI0011AEC076|nr:CocE/NonD family hydrolase [Gemmatimonas phototrophica]
MNAFLQSRTRAAFSWLAAAALLSACHAVPAVVTHQGIMAADSVRIAADVILPPVVPDGGVPVVFIQTRYWRSFHLRGGTRNNTVPMGPREAIVEKLVTAGFAVVVTDVRGTGASGGEWPWPWSEGEVRDMGPVIDWIVAQRWSNGAVGATGVSYEGTTALLAAGAGRPALRAVLARELEWNLVDEIIAPGNVRNVGFVSSWSRSVDALDHGRFPELFPRLARLGIRGVQPIDDDSTGVLLTSLQQRRPPTDVAGSVVAVRRGSDRFGRSGPPADSLGPAGHAAALAATSAVVGIWGSWWDGATADAVLRAVEQMPIREAVIGPWAHEGTSNASPLRRDDSERATVDLDAVVAFFRRHLVERNAPAVPRMSWYVAGTEAWTSAERWPVTAPRTLYLVGEQLVSTAAASAPRSLTVDFSASTGKNTRWTTGLARPVDAPDRSDARGVISWQSAALEAPLSVFGAPEFVCRVALDAPEAALHVYVESVDRSGRVRLLTEGVQRIGAGQATVRIRPVAFELPAGWSLRLSVAGADAPSFERVPAAGAQRMQFAGEGCRLTVPVVR